MTRSKLAARLESKAFATGSAQVRRVTGSEALGRLFWFDVDVVVTGEVDTSAIEGSTATLLFSVDEERGSRDVRRVHGVVAEIEDALDTETDTRQLRLRLVPRAFRMTLVKTQEVFLGKSIPEVIREKLALVGVGENDIELRLADAYPPREFIVQYQETDLAFISRWAEHAGISFYFDHEGDADRMIFTDGKGFEAFSSGEVVGYHGRGEKRGVHRISSRMRLVPNMFIEQDYNYATPQLHISGEAEAPNGLGGGVHAFGSNVATPMEALALAKVRSEEHEAQHDVFSGEASLPELEPGRILKLEGHKRLGDKRLLITSVEHHLTQTAGMHAGGDDDTYVAKFTAVDAELRYRPPRVTPRPRISGLVTAVVEPLMLGDTSKFAKIDAHGRYIVRFHFDTRDHGPERPSLPVRMLQPHAGAGYGMHFPLKPGVEVVVAFLDGDPDQPMIVGAVPNAVTPSPVVQASNTHHRIRTESGILIELKDA